MADEMWEEKKHLVKRKGEAANSKLLLPVGMIFVGILLMIIVPAFTNM
jgi:tight adherence protein C